MAKYEAFPLVQIQEIDCQCGAILWVVARRRSDGQIGCGSKVVAQFTGETAEKDAKCHAAKLNERESGAAYPERYDADLGAKLVEEGEKFIAGMAAQVKSGEANRGQ